MAEGSSSRGGLVKNLLFPSFVDSGANEAFQEASHDDIEDSNDVNSNNNDRDESCVSVFSDASTEVKNNLSFIQTATGRRLLQAASRDEGEGDNEDGTSVHRRNEYYNRSSPLPTAPATPSFFASTNPRTSQSPLPIAPSSSLSKTSQAASILHPKSPPTVPRYTRARSFSHSSPKAMTATTETPAAGQFAFRAQPPSPSVASYQKRLAALKTQSFSPTASPRNKTWTTTTTAPWQSKPHGRGSNERPSMPSPRLRERQDTHHRITVETQDFQNDDVFNQQQLQAMDDEGDSQQPQNVSTLVQTGQAQHSVKPEECWEEEATPAQTAFGKELLFRREEYKRNANDDDDASTASEMGTVVGAAHMYDLDDMQEFYHGTSSNNQRDGAVADALQSSENDDDDNDDLSLPMLDRRSAALSQIFEDEKKSEKDAGENMFYKAIRRIGSFRESNTAPNSPATRNYIQALTPSGRIPEDAPASFLLRSPGSSVHVAAKTEYQRNNNTMLAPRFLSMKESLGTPRTDGDDHDFRSFGSQMTKQFFLARGCLSFDTFDTTADEGFEIPSQRLNNPQAQHQGLYRASASWDTGTRAARTANSQSIPFRPRSSHMRPRPHPENASSIAYVPGSTATMDPRVRQRTRSPDRLEVEREDALDILACLVERGISLQVDENASDVDAGVEVEAIDGDARIVVDSPTKCDVIQVVDQLRELLKVDSSAATNRTEGLMALDELVRSHEYATEMQRASFSAASWLKSVGRTVGAKNTELVQASERDTTSESQPAGESASEGLNLLTCKAMLHSAQMETREKDEIIDRLNEELANCKAEIGRLRSTATNASTSFRSPNRSILDEDDNSGTEEEGVDKLNGSFGNHSPILSPREIDEDVKRLQADGDETVKMQAALHQANEVIRRLFVGLRNASGETASPDDAPVVTVQTDDGNPVFRFPSDDADSTEWKVLHPSLAAPPDHDLRSPQVAAVLNEWTGDAHLHESLLSWIQSALEGDDTSDLPPLMLSNLNRQVLDGFVTHILPCLRRRDGMRVDIKTRCYPSTAYDLAVTVDAITRTNHGPHFTTPHRRDTSNSEVTTFSTSTATISNTNKISRRFTFEDINHRNRDLDMRRASSRLSYDEMADAPLKPVETTPGIMGTLGGALGYLSSLRKTPAGTPGASSVDTPSMRGILESPARPKETAMDDNHPSDSDEDFVHPFHRVLSAPAGRLFITFVEYRGHAVVSDVAPESPLVGFIFPSDVLIAIDELAVSGLRVRDIVKLLKDRSHKQRSLRVISSHDMTALTLHTSMINDGAD